MLKSGVISNKELGPGLSTPSFDNTAMMQRQRNSDMAETWKNNSSLLRESGAKRKKALLTKKEKAPSPGIRTLLVEIIINN